MEHPLVQHQDHRRLPDPLATQAQEARQVLQFPGHERFEPSLDLTVFSRRTPRQSGLPSLVLRQNE